MNKISGRAKLEAFDIGVISGVMETLPRSLLSLLNNKVKISDKTFPTSTHIAIGIRGK